MEGNEGFLQQSDACEGKIVQEMLDSTTELIFPSLEITSENQILLQNQEAEACGNVFIGAEVKTEISIFLKSISWICVVFC